MARPRKNASVANNSGPASSSVASWAEALGEALGRGVARGINTGLSGGQSVGAAMGARRRGRPPKVQPGMPISSDRLCRINGCGRAARSKGLCSAHYQAERRKQLAK
jgi:hypothetical protein